MRSPSLLRRLLFFAPVVVALASASLPGAAPRPNIVVIFTDDQGYQDLGCFGSKSIKTPQIDRMAAEGLMLTSFYAQPVCGVSRASLMTGSYPIRVGEPGNVKRLHTVPHPEELESGAAGARSCDFLRQQPRALCRAARPWVHVGAQGGGGFKGTTVGEHALGGPAALQFSGQVNSDVADGRVKPDAPAEQLYHLGDDPRQARNVIREHPEVAARLAGLLRTIRAGSRTAPMP